ncbi:vacuolar protein sorting-associated protein 16 homolog [Aplysia californica]|uniref:Vacuolar protein sorting-associated protein 16 homolog n=1 Tax=Aplysia californica TaxID=6500 RepID=A0ABM1VXI4_APLCA|nr:vacuolar protein sorting-associated protein 16 homolog [Aplysia californica]
MATADWNPLGEVYYRKCELYTMEWSGLVDLAKHTVAASSYGGPIALMKDDSKTARVTTTIKPVISVYNAAGKLLSQMRWNSGTVVTMGWSATEELLCVQEDGVVLVYDMFLTFKKTFSMGQEAKDVKILDAKIFASFQGTGIAVMTTSFRIFLISNVDSPRIVRLAEVPGLNEAPNCWTIVVSDRQARALVAKGGELYLVDQGGQFQQQQAELSENAGDITELAVSFNNKYLALCTKNGALWIGSADLQKKYCEFNTSSPMKPQQLVWCGNGAVVALWDKLILVVGPDKDWIKYNMDCSVHLLQEEDGLRIIGNDTHEFLQKVPAVTEQIFKIGSMEPGAMLYEASKEFQKRNQKADEYIRMIKDKLEVAVNQCIQAAGQEVEPGKQRTLLRAASFGKCFLTDYRPELFVNMCQMLRVLNQVRHHSVGIPLTYTQLEHLSMPVLIDRLVLRKLFGLSVRICQYLKIPDAEGRSRILAHWACFKVQQKHEDEEKLARAISQKLLDVPGVSFSEIASQALEHGRKQLAVKLLDYEPRASEQVPLLLKMGQDQTALTKAIDSGDTDLVYTVLLHLRDKMASAGDFFMMIRTMPIACSLYIQYCRQQNLKLVEDLYYQEDNSLEEGNCKVIRSYTLEHLEERAKLLEDAMNCFHRCKNEFAAKQTEEQVRLLRHQRRLEDDTGNSYADLSLQQTLRKLIGDGNHGHVEKLRKEFKVPDKRFWMLKISALAEVGDWSELEKLSKTKKPPVTLEVFVDACMKQYNRTEAVRYVSRVQPEQRVKCLVKVGQFREAAEAAIENKSEEDFDYVLSRLGLADRQVAETVRGMRGQLMARR